LSDWLWLRFRLLPALLAALPLQAAGPTANVTFYKEVLPILQKNCQGCHRPGEIGPMSFLTYESTRPWAKAIKTEVLTRKMPPWFADPKYGHFSNNRRLSDAQINLLVSWVDGGAPEGDPKDKPAPMQWRDGWNIQPDEIFQMPDAYQVPATGTLDYVYIVLPTGFTRDTWVTAAEVRPGNRSVVHHITAVIRPRGSQWMKDAKPFKPYIPPHQSEEGEPDKDDPLTAPVDMNYEFLAGYAPGMPAERFDVDHSAKLIPAGADIILQLHYTTNGKTAVEDQTRVGITVAKEAPPKRFYSAVVAGSHWAIPPGDPNYEARASMTFGEPVELVFIQPHMHLRGKDMTVSLTWPSGQTETLLSVPHYDFGWQIVYYLAKPMQLPKGAKVQVIAHWDNSANNPSNPDPTKTVKWGDQSWDEMLSVPMGVIVNRD
jgi:mono/diheme cytochrome c family protein